MTELPQRLRRKSAARDRKGREREVQNNNTGFLSLRSQTVTKQKQASNKEHDVLDQAHNSISLPHLHSDIRQRQFMQTIPKHEVYQLKLFFPQSGDIMT